VDTRPRAEHEVGSKDDDVAFDLFVDLELGKDRSPAGRGRNHPRKA
jgi:hypothetical protein